MELFNQGAECKFLKVFFSKIRSCHGYMLNRGPCMIFPSGICLDFLPHMHDVWLLWQLWLFHTTLLSLQKFELCELQLICVYYCRMLTQTRLHYSFNFIRDWHDPRRNFQCFYRKICNTLVGIHQ